MKKIKILSKLITILSASFLVCSNFNAMENTKDKNLKTNNTNNINTNANENNSKNKPIYEKDIMKNPFEKDILKEEQNLNDDENNNVNLLNKKRNKNDSVNDNNNDQLINNKKNIRYNKNKFKSKKTKI